MHSIHFWSTFFVFFFFEKLHLRFVFLIALLCVCLLGNGVTLQFTDFDVAQSENCNRDYLEVRDGNSSGKLLGVFCGNAQPSTISHNNSLWLFFESKPVDGDDVLTGKGFMLEYNLSMKYFSILKKHHAKTTLKSDVCEYISIYNQIFNLLECSKTWCTFI